MTYSELNFIFLFVAAIATWFVKSKYQCFTSVSVLLPMLVITAIFDNLIVGFGIVDYDPSKLIGLRILFAPIEDFAYILVSVMLVPAIWKAVAK
jgi:lycopene cyclase domain-containing protein